MQAPPCHPMALVCSPFQSKSASFIIPALPESRSPQHEPPTQFLLFFWKLSRASGSSICTLLLCMENDVQSLAVTKCQRPEDYEQQKCISHSSGCGRGPAGLCSNDGVVLGYTQLVPCISTGAGKKARSPVTLIPLMRALLS